MGLKPRQHLEHYESKVQTHPDPGVAAFSVPLKLVSGGAGSGWAELLPQGAPVRAELLPQPQGSEPACCHPSTTPGHFHCHCHPRTPRFCHRTGCRERQCQQLLPIPIALGAAEIHGIERSRVLQSVLGRPEQGNWKFTAPPEAERTLQDTDTRRDGSAGGEAQSRFCSEKEICICCLQLLEVEKYL